MKAVTSAPCFSSFTIANDLAAMVLIVPRKTPSAGYRYYSFKRTFLADFFISRTEMNRLRYAHIAALNGREMKRWSLPGVVESRDDNWLMRGWVFSKFNRRYIGTVGRHRTSPLSVNQRRRTSAPYFVGGLKVVGGRTS